MAGGEDPPFPYPAPVTSMVFRCSHTPFEASTPLEDDRSPTLSATSLGPAFSRLRSAIFILTRHHSFSSSFRPAAPRRQRPALHRLRRPSLPSPIDPPTFPLFDPEAGSRRAPDTIYSPISETDPNARKNRHGEQGVEVDCKHDSIDLPARRHLGIAATKPTLLSVSETIEPITR